MLLLVILSLVIETVICADPCHGGECHSVQVVDNAYNDLQLYYSDHLCKEMVKLNCDHYNAHGDERVCGTDHYTYPNHCLFVKKRCFVLLEMEHGNMFRELKVLNEGPCGGAMTTTQVLTTAAQMMSGATVNIGGQSSNPPATVLVAQTSGLPNSQPIVTGSSIPQMTTTQGAPVSTTTAAATQMMTTTTSGMTTQALINGMIASVFCKTASTIDCNTGFNIVCATDGQYYPNECELSKAKCLNSQLTRATDPSICAAP